jgi:endonuclease/exonuclease/phosphatase family metal-dependent hydrolase
MIDLRIATLNLWNKNFYWEKRKPLIIEAIKTINPDILAFQEVIQEKQKNTAEAIASELKNYNAYFYPELENARKTSGLAILTKLTITKSHLLKLSRYFEDPLDRGNKLFGCIEFKINKRNFVFGNTWLALSESAQLRTIREIKYFLEKQIGIKDKICVIAGDFNNISQKPISQVKSIGETGMVSVWEKTNREEITTWPTSKNLFIKNWNKKHPNKEMDFKIIPRKVDYIFIPKIKNVKIKNCRLFANNPNEEKIYPSDHAGLFCDLQIFPL